MLLQYHHHPPPSPATPCERSLSPPLDDLVPAEFHDPYYSFNRRLSNAVHVLGTEATALSCLTRLYERDSVAREGFDAAVEAITRFKGDKGKLVIAGVGKSGHIAKKLVATMNSLKIHATYLHPTEALHGDLGKVGKYDTILLITFSGKTPELLSLLPHFDKSLPLIVLTSHTHPSTCEIVKRRPDAILLPAPIHKSEIDSFGFPAPTTSTTMALAIGDALAVVISNELHIDVAAVFSQYHPGGAIGAASKGPPKLSDLAIQLRDIPEIIGKTKNGVSGAHVLMAAYRSKSGWVRDGEDIVMPPRRIEKLQVDDMDEPAVNLKKLMVRKSEWITVDPEMSVPNAKEWVLAMRQLQGGSKYDDDAVLMLVDDGEICGVMEVGALTPGSGN